MKPIFKNILMISVSLLTIAAAFETTGYFLYTPPEAHCTNCGQVRTEDILGMVDIPDNSFEATMTCGQSPCYKAKYTFDHYGRRLTETIKKSDSHLVLFGCSFTFGEGLNDQETLSYLLSQNSKHHVYNYGRVAAGISYTLALLQYKNLPAEISESRGIGIYLLTSFHAERSSISSERPWLWNSPYYDFDEAGNLKYMGSQKQAEPTRAFLYKSYNNIKEHSYFLSWLGRELYAKSEDYNEKLLIASLKEAKIAYEKTFNGRFIVIGHPLNGVSKELADKIKKEGIEFHQIQEMTLPRNEITLCKCDFHPNGLANKYLSNAILNIIN